MLLVRDSYAPFFIVLILIFLALLSYFFNKKNMILRELKKSRPTTISRARQNEYIKLVGKAIGGNDPLIAPLSKRPCYYYYILVEKKGDKSWHKYLEDHAQQDFFLEVNGERAIIKPALTRLEFKKTFFVLDHEENSGSFNDARPHLEAFLRKHGTKSTGILGFNKTLRFSEGIIEPNEMITVKGIAQWKTIKEPFENFNYSNILTLKGDKNNKLIITDLPETVIKEKRRL